MVSEYLKLVGNYTIEWACDAHSALEKLTDAAQYDVLLLDYRLPDGTGLDILDKLSSQAVHPPVIMITGQGDELIAAQSIQRGAAEYLIKGSSYLPRLPALIQKVIRDTEMQAEIQESLEKIRYQALLLNNVQDSVIVWNKEGAITFWNSAAEQLSGWKAVERLGQSAADVYFPMFSPAPDPGNYLHGEVERLVHTRGGEKVWVSSKITPLHPGGQDDLASGFMDVLRDITERRRMEGLIQTMNAQLIQSARLAAIGELSSGVAHRISNPLVTVIANAQILKRDLGDKQAAFEAAVDIEKAGWQAQQVVKQLLEFSRPASSESDQVDINQTIQAALVLVESQIQHAGIQLAMKLGTGLPPIWGVKRQLEDLWVNLLLLGRDAASVPGQHTIWIRTIQEDPGDILVEVCDDGQPIPKEQLERIFEPNFFGVNIGRGSGLEFSICQEIVRQHRGRIQAARNGKYTIFSITLPVFDRATWTP
jgi:PAS domain S-box-containing protein